MNNFYQKRKKIILSIFGSLASYGLITGLLVPLPVWKYVAIEAIFSVGWVLTERELKKG